MTNRNATDHLTREEAASVLRVSLSTIDRYLRDGTVPKHKVGKRLVRVRRADVDAFLSSPAVSTPQHEAAGVPSEAVA